MSTQQGGKKNNPKIAAIQVSVTMMEIWNYDKFLSEGQQYADGLMRQVWIRAGREKFSGDLFTEVQQKSIQLVTEIMEPTVTHQIDNYVKKCIQARGKIDGKRPITEKTLDDLDFFNKCVVRVVAFRAMKSLKPELMVKNIIPVVNQAFCDSLSDDAAQIFGLFHRIPDHDDGAREAAIAKASPTPNTRSEYPAAINNAPPTPHRPSYSTMSAPATPQIPMMQQMHAQNTMLHNPMMAQPQWQTNPYAMAAHMGSMNTAPYYPGAAMMSHAYMNPAMAMGMNMNMNHPAMMPQPHMNMMRGGAVMGGMLPTAAVGKGAAAMRGRGGAAAGAPGAMMYGAPGAQGKGGAVEHHMAPQGQAKGALPRGPVGPLIAAGKEKAKRGKKDEKNASGSSSSSSSSGSSSESDDDDSSGDESGESSNESDASNSSQRVQKKRKNPVPFPERRPSDRAEVAAVARIKDGGGEGGATKDGKERKGEVKKEKAALKDGEDMKGEGDKKKVKEEGHEKKDDVPDGVESPPLPGALDSDDEPVLKKRALDSDDEPVLKKRALDSDDEPTPMLKMPTKKTGEMLINTQNLAETAIKAQHGALDLLEKGTQTEKNPMIDPNCIIWRFRKPKRKRRRRMAD